MFVDRSNYDDCKKYFLNTFIKCRETEDVIYQVSDVTRDRILLKKIDGEVVFVDISGEHSGQVGYNLDYVMPKKTVFQLGETAVFLHRIPARMWMKGMSNKNTKFECLLVQGWANMSFDINTVQSFCNKPSYMGFEEALPLLESCALQSAALNNRVSINKSGFIYVDTVPVGKYSEEKKEVALRRIFVPELKSLFSPYKIKELK